MAYMTQEGYDKMVAQLRRMETIDRPAASAAIAEARDKGDLSENSEYDAAKEAQGMLEMKISNLKAAIADAKIIDPAMLRTYDGYPAYLKARIGGDGGHLSNPQAAAAITSLATSRTQVVVGMHISQHTNLPSTCRAVLEGACGGRRVLVASQAVPLSCE